MNTYNMMNGVNPSTFFILPMLGHHPNEYPRFRDCFLQVPEVSSYEEHIHVYTRTGSSKTEELAEECAKFFSHSQFVKSIEDPEDSTFEFWVFSIPDKWKDDYKVLKETGDVKALSLSYKQEILNMFPKIEKQLRDALEVT